MDVDRNGADDAPDVGTDRHGVCALARSGRPVSPRERLDERPAAGEISVEEHLTRRSELEQLFCPTLDIERQGEHLRIDIDHDEFDRFIDRALQ